jgi:hypothetical protein
MHKKIAALAILALFVSPVFALAQSANVQSQITALLAQLKSLEAQIAALQSNSATNVPAEPQSALSSHTSVVQFGYYDTATAGLGTGDYISQVAQLGNVVWVSGNTNDEVLQKVKEAEANHLGVILMVQNTLFPSQSSQIYSDYQGRFDALWAALDGHHDAIKGFYLFDEPFANNAQTAGWNQVYWPTFLQYLNNAAGYMKQQAPGIPVIMAYGAEMGYDNFSQLSVPNVDWIGFDCYFEAGCTSDQISLYFAKILAIKTPAQKIIILPDAYVYQTGSDAQTAATVSFYQSLVDSSPDVVAVYPFLYASHDGALGAESLPLTEQALLNWYTQLQSGGQSTTTVQASALAAPPAGSSSVGGGTAQNLTTGSAGSTPTTVSSPSVQNIPALTASANTTVITPGQSATLTWSSQNATTCEAATVTGTVLASGATQTNGTVSVSPSVSTRYVFDCSNSFGLNKAVLDIYVLQPGMTSIYPQVTFTASQASITPGQHVTLTWSASNATMCESAQFSTGGAVSGSLVVAPEQTASYTVQCYGPGGSDLGKTGSALVTVTVPQPQQNETVTSIAPLGTANATYQKCTAFGTLSSGLAASPVSGTSPLTVCFDSGFSGSSTITFGDGGSRSGIQLSDWPFAYTYAVPGNYAPMLYNSSNVQVGSVADIVVGASGTATQQTPACPSGTTGTYPLCSAAPVANAPTGSGAPIIGLFRVYGGSPILTNSTIYADLTTYNMLSCVITAPSGVTAETALSNYSTTNVRSGSEQYTASAPGAYTFVLTCAGTDGKTYTASQVASVVSPSALNPTCPAGTAGTYPNCAIATTCPTGYVLQSNQCVRTTATAVSGPTCSMTSSPSSVALGQPFTITWTSTNAATAQLDDFNVTQKPEPTSGSATISTASLRAAQTVQEFISVSDAQGNRNGCSVSVNVTNSAPTAGQASATIDVATMTTNTQTPTITGTASNISWNNSVLWLQGNTTNWMSGNITPDSGGRWSVTVGKPLPNGSYSVQFLSANQVLTSGTLDVLANTLAPTAAISIAGAPSAGAPPLIVQFTINNLPLTGIADAYAVDWGDGTLPVLISNFCKDAAICSTATPQHLYSAPGTYTATVHHYATSGACATSTAGSCGMQALVSAAPVLASSNAITVVGSAQTTVAPAASGSGSSVCMVNAPSCPNYPAYAGSYTDPDSTAQNNPTRCAARAQEYYTWCGAHSPVTTSSVQNGSVIQTTIYPSAQASAAETANLANVLSALKSALQTLTTLFER